jgi:hypothetical protein
MLAAVMPGETSKPAEWCFPGAGRYRKRAVSCVKECEDEHVEEPAHDVANGYVSAPAYVTEPMPVMSSGSDVTDAVLRYPCQGRTSPHYVPVERFLPQCTIAAVQA